jgi:TRAP transporter TAXI family solute receptor
MKPERRRLVLGGTVAVLMLVAAWLTFAYTEPAPPKRVTLATGIAGGAYLNFGQDLAKLVEKAHGPRVTVRPTEGSAENLRRLARGEVDVAFVQSGTISALAGTIDTSKLRAIARVYYEPLWVFHRGATELTQLRELRTLPGEPTRRIAVGPEGSGTSVIALELLRDNGISAENAQLLRSSTGEAIDAFERREVDVLFLIASPRAESIQRLLHMPDVRLMSFANHKAYARRFPYLEAVELDQGLLSLEDNIPDRPIVLLAPSATLLTREDVHPRIVELFTKAAVERFSGGDLLDAAGAFPDAELLEVPQHAAAHRFMTDGESWMSRHFAFWFLRLLARLKLILIPIVTVLVPSVRFLPLLFRLRVARVLKKKYELLAAVEDAMRRARTPAELQVQIDATDRLRDEVAELTLDMPERSHTAVYDFRLHANLVYQEGMERLAVMKATPAPVAAVPAAVPAA